MQVIGGCSFKFSGLVYFLTLFWPFFCTFPFQYITFSTHNLLFFPSEPLFPWRTRKCRSLGECSFKFSGVVYSPTSVETFSRKIISATCICKSNETLTKLACGMLSAIIKEKTNVNRLFLLKNDPRNTFCDTALK